MDAEIKLYGSTRERRAYEDLADLYARTRRQDTYLHARRSAGSANARSALSTCRLVSQRVCVVRETYCRR